MQSGTDVGSGSGAGAVGRGLWTQKICYSEGEHECDQSRDSPHRADQRETCHRQKLLPRLMERTNEQRSEDLVLRAWAAPPHSTFNDGHPV